MHIQLHININTYSLVTSIKRISYLFSTAKFLKNTIKHIYDLVLKKLFCIKTL